MNTVLRRLLVTVFLLVPVVTYAETPQEMIVGEWLGADHTGLNGGFVFEENGNAQMIHGDEVVNSKTLGVSIMWQLNADKNPMHLDIVISATPSSEERKTLPMIVRFISETKIQLQKADENMVRPAEFSDSDKGNQIILTKQ